MTEMKSLTLNGQTYDCFVDSVARSLMEVSAVVGSASGEQIVVSDASNYNLVGLHIYGKTTQDGTPSLDAPVDLVSVGDSGSITVDTTGKNEGRSITIATPNGLPGIQVDSGGNYIDANGQQWICDEIDFARGVYIRRVNRITLNGSESWTHFSNEFGVNQFRTKVNDCYTNNSLTNAVSSRFIGISFSERNYNYNTIYTATQSPDNFIYVNINLSVAPTEFAALLAEKPTEVLYRLATPIETPLSAEELADYGTLRTYKDNTTISNDAGASMDVEYMIDSRKYIDQLITSLIATPARISSVTLPASAWAGSDGLYSQIVIIDGITEYSKVDLQPSVEQLAIFHNKDVAFVTENENGVVTVYAIGDKPIQDYTMQVQITEVRV